MDLQEATKYHLRDAIVSILEKDGYKTLTSIQEEALKAGLCNGESLVISAPTSSGKTTIAEIAAVEGAMQGKKSVYLVTHKALAEEKFKAFQSRYAQESNKWFEVSIATGDHTEGDWQNGILVATYEKYLSLLGGSKFYSTKDKVVIADEIQILSEESRGSDIEILCSIIKYQKPYQLVALSATAPNDKELAYWLECKPVTINYRDVKLREEIWYRGIQYYKYYGYDETYDTKLKKNNHSTLDVVNSLLEKNLGPILVFTMTKKQAIELAQDFSQSRSQDVSSYNISDQLDLFSEPTTLSRALKSISERRVAFHSADLSFSERQVVEEAIKSGSLDVVFSTSTLASGVNFPIHTVVFDSFTRPWNSNSPWIPKAEYLNMSGRAGRLGFHEEGVSILLPTDNIEFSKAKEYLSGDQTPIESVLMEKSIRKSVLGLIAMRICKTSAGIEKFFQLTFWYYQQLEHNPKLIERLSSKLSDAIQWLSENKLIAITNKTINPTRLGVAIFSTGLLPSTGVWLVNLVQSNVERFNNEDFQLPLIHAVCSSDEFKDKIGTRFLPYAYNDSPENSAWVAVKNSKPFIENLTEEGYGKVINASYGVYLWSQGTKEFELRAQLRRISYGQFYGLSTDVSWILDGLSNILKLPDLNIDSTIPTKIELLSEQVRFGVPLEVIDILKAAQMYNVPGFGRHRAMYLVENKLSDPNDLLKQDIKKVIEIMEQKTRAEKLVDAVFNYFPKKLLSWKNKHLRKVTELSKDQKLIIESYESTGLEYEECIEKLLSLFDWEVRKLDASKRQGVPDFLIIYENKSLVLECKTKDKENATIEKDAALDVLTKSSDINMDHAVTLGKPDFGTFSKNKATGSKRITLLPHYYFIEAVICFWEGKQTTSTIFNWLLIPGVADIKTLDQLGESTN